MIRRDVLTAAGRPGWLLISQVEHARLSGELCQVWSALQSWPGDIREEVIAAVFHHDDGWSGWEQSPEVNTATGRPREFTEMPLAESLDIWSRSIDQSSSFGNLAPYMISGHFCALMHRFTHWRQQGPQQVTLGETFLRDQQAQQAIWLDRWRSVDPITRTTVLAQQALHWLQLFDALSLWLCCAERRDPQEFESPVDLKFVFTPHSLEEIGVSPWPITIASLSLQLNGRCVPAVKYTNDRELADVAGETTTLRWKLVAK